MNVAISLILHVLGAILWVGSLQAMSRALVMMAKTPGPGRASLGDLAGRFNIMAMLGLLLALPSGLYQLHMWPAGAFRITRWMHHKLTLALILFVVHVLLIRMQRAWVKQPADAPLSRGQASALHGIVGLMLIAILVVVYVTRQHYLHIPVF